MHYSHRTEIRAQRQPWKRDTSALLSALSFVCECRKIEPEKLTLNEREMVALADERDRLRALLCDAVGALDSRLLAAWGSDLEERICRELEPTQ